MMDYLFKEIDGLVEKIRDNRASTTIYDDTVNLGYLWAKLCDYYALLQDKYDESFKVFMVENPKITIAKAEREMQCTSEAKELFRVKMKIKGIERFLSQCRDLKHKLEGEVRGQY